MKKNQPKPRKPRTKKTSKKITSEPNIVRVDNFLKANYSSATYQQWQRLDEARRERAEKKRAEQFREDNAYFAGYDYSYISAGQYEEIWKLLTNDFTRQVYAEGFGRFSFGSAGEEEDWITGQVYDECYIDYYNKGTNAENSIIFAGDTDYSFFQVSNATTQLPYGVVFESGIEMKFHGDAPFKSNGEALIQWLQELGQGTLLPLNPISSEVLKDLSDGWINWAGILRRDKDYIRFTDKGLELLGGLSEVVDPDTDLDAPENLEALITWLSDETVIFPFSK